MTFFPRKLYSIVVEIKYKPGNNWKIESQGVAKIAYPIEIQGRYETKSWKNYSWLKGIELFMEDKWDQWERRGQWVSQVGR